MKNTYCRSSLNILFVCLLLNLAVSINGINLKVKPKANDEIEERKINEMKQSIKDLSLGNHLTYYCLVFTSPFIHPSMKHSLNAFANELNSISPKIIEMKYNTTAMNDSLHLYFKGRAIYEKHYDDHFIPSNVFSAIIVKMTTLKKSNRVDFKYFIEKYSIQPFGNQINPNSFIQQASSPFYGIDLLYSNSLPYANDYRFTRLLLALVLVISFSLFVFVLFNKSVKWAESSQLLLNSHRDSCLMEMISNKSL